MATERLLREHLKWHLRRLKGARAAAAELSLRAETDSLQWLSLTHFAVLALEATLAEDVAPDHRALQEVIADLAQPMAGAQPTRAGQAPAGEPPAPETRSLPRPPPLMESWSSALASFQALAFPWRPSAGRDSNLRGP